MPRRCLTARRHGNDDDTGERSSPPSPPPRPSLVATPPTLRYIAKTSGVDDVSHRPPPPAHWDTATLCNSPPSPPHHLFPNDRKDGWDRRCRLARPLGRRPCLADKLGTNAHHVTSTAELLDGTAADSMDHGETDSPPPDTPIQKKISQVKE
ncbi:hypothetical protein WOLCODRAFT_159074 [Wolfiporia cocos MD-104 SS10]|uniref:Uncharacterized protein n=1 Tax=Wolfiporia cocos (strain MD-104) TaxID=742152 RepID=A0A2H3JB79_WOLCO|nr:hypothetical protein WOLCODRAFT_159074 [Wolfiporia cocos MD-104 SS10]